MLAQQREHLLLWLGESLVGQGKCRRDAAVADGEFVVAAGFVAESVSEGTDRPGRPGAQAGGGDTDGQRQVSTQAQYVRCGLTIGAYLVVADYRREQCKRVGFR